MEETVGTNSESHFSPSKFENLENKEAKYLEKSRSIIYI
jgi:hypothetical protein